MNDIDPEEPPVMQPPDTTEPAPQLRRRVPHAPNCARIVNPYDAQNWCNCGAAEENERRSEVPVATPTPDLDPEEVRRACEVPDAADWVLPLQAAAREWLRLREQTDEPFTWERVARRVGEEFSNVGPDGYYSFTPAQWQDWMLSRIYALRKQPALDEDEFIVAPARCCCGHVNVIGGEIIDPGPCPVHDTTPTPAIDPVAVETARNILSKLPSAQPAPDVQAQIDAAVERERGRVIGIFVGELQKLHEKTVLDCGDNSCLFATRRGGMRTNGGCRCIERLLDAGCSRA